MKHPHLLAWALSTPWAMRPDSMAAYAMVLAAHYGTPGALAAAVSNFQAGSEPQAAAPSSSRRSGNVAVVPVTGPIVEWPGQIDMCEGGTSTRQISAALTELEADDSVVGIVLAFSTPGGSVYGVQEAGDTINRVKGRKPVYGVAQSLAASAGYWLLSQCTEAYCSPGGEVGSIGVYSGHEDISKALEMQGVKIELFSAGKYKTEGSPFEPLGEEARAAMQARVNDYYSLFVRAVAKGRGVSVDDVRGGFGEGRVVGAQQAVKLGMADRVDTYDATVARLARGGTRPSGQRADSEDIDLRRRRMRLLSH